MFDFLKKLFGYPTEAEKAAAKAPYKVETPVNPQITDSVTQQSPAWHTAPSSDTKPVTVVDALDVNNDGKVDIKDVKAAVKNAGKRVKKAADVDGDGKVTVKDAKAAVKKAAPKRGRKPKAK